MSILRELASLLGFSVAPAINYTHICYVLHCSENEDPNVWADSAREASTEKISHRSLCAREIRNSFETWPWKSWKSFNCSPVPLGYLWALKAHSLNLNRKSFPVWLSLTGGCTHGTSVAQPSSLLNLWSSPFWAVASLPLPSFLALIFGSAQW